MRSILLVSGNTTAFASVAARLEQAGYLLIGASGVDEALESLAAIVPGAVVIDLPPRPAARLVSRLVASPGVRMIPRLMVVDPGAPVSSPSPFLADQSAAAFVAPLEPEHLIRALAALYATEIPSPSSAGPRPELRRDDCIDEALRLIAEPEVMATAPAPAQGGARLQGPSPRAEAVVYSYLTELASRA